MEIILAKPAAHTHTQCANIFAVYFADFRLQTNQNFCSNTQNVSWQMNGNETTVSNVLSCPVLSFRQ